jgi:Fe-S-cluster containining protein
MSEGHRVPQQLIEACREQLSSTKNLLRRNTNPLSLASALQHSTDEFVAKYLEEGEAGAKKKVACKLGCSFCCFQPVDVSADTVLFVGNHIKNLPIDAQNEFWRKVSEKATAIRELAGITRNAVITARIGCPALNGDGSCSIYAVRPNACRGVDNFNALDCEKLFADPAHTSSFTWARLAAEGTRIGHILAFRDRRFDSRLYDFTLALDELRELGMTDATVRWNNKQNVFTDAALAIPVSA